jgi:hypothetical protein
MDEGGNVAPESLEMIHQSQSKVTLTFCICKKSFAVCLSDGTKDMSEPTGFPPVCLPLKKLDNPPHLFNQQ